MSFGKLLSLTRLGKEIWFFHFKLSLEHGLVENSMVRLASRMTTLAAQIFHLYQLGASACTGKFSTDLCSDGPRRERSYFQLPSVFLMTDTVTQFPINYVAAVTVLSTSFCQLG